MTAANASANIQDEATGPTTHFFIWGGGGGGGLRKKYRISRIANIQISEQIQSQGNMLFSVKELMIQFHFSDL